MAINSRAPLANSTRVSANSTRINGTASSGSGTKKYKHFECGTTIANATEDLIKTSKELLRNRHKGSPAGLGSLHQRRQGPIVVNVYFHVVTKTESAGSITQEMATQQIQALNVAYNPYDIQFNLQDTTFTVNDAWAVGADADDQVMKQTLRKGTYKDLNIYFQSDLEGYVLGKCSLPAEIHGTVDPSAYASDGCNVNANTMPGGSISEYNLGQTAVHETGHWLGLFHVFEGYACEGDGDMIEDTPLQGASTDGCPIDNTQDSCPTAPGVDSIHNVMDYSYDNCYEGFTNLQVQRMKDMFNIYRSPH